MNYTKEKSLKDLNLNIKTNTTVIDKILIKDHLFGTAAVYGRCSSQSAFLINKRKQSVIDNLNYNTRVTIPIIKVNKKFIHNSKNWAQHGLIEHKIKNYINTMQEKLLVKLLSMATKSNIVYNMSLRSGIKKVSEKMSENNAIIETILCNTFDCHMLYHLGLDKKYTILPSRQVPAGVLYCCENPDFIGVLPIRSFKIEKTEGANIALKFEFGMCILSTHGCFRLEI